MRRLFLTCFRRLPPPVGALQQHAQLLRRRFSTRAALLLVVIAPLDHLHAASLIIIRLDSHITSALLVETPAPRAFRNCAACASFILQPISPGICQILFVHHEWWYNSSFVDSRQVCQLALRAERSRSVFVSIVFSLNLAPRSFSAFPPASKRFLQWQGPNLCHLANRIPSTSSLISSSSTGARIGIISLEIQLRSGPAIRIIPLLSI